LIDHEKNIDENSPWPKEWLIDKEINDATNLRNDTWLCSFSKIHDSMLMWSHYCRNHTGVCIGINVEKVLATVPDLFAFGGVLEYEIQYHDLIEKKRPYLVNAWYHQLMVKAKDWEYEQEVRLIAHNPMGLYSAFTLEQAQRNSKEKVWDWREIHEYMPIKGEYFESIYFGINTQEEDKTKIINHARKHLNPNIKIYQMQVDDAAFRLKAVEIK
jgi:hypothetical protein